jgi:HEAT repeat protein
MEPSDLLALLDDPSLHPAVRWSAADALLQAQESGSPALLATLLTTASPSDDQSQAARCYLLACGDDADRAVLADPQAAGWMVGWQHDRSMGQQRRTRTVRALLDSPTTPAVLRATVLALLTGGPDGDTRETLVCLCSDPDPSRRRAALEAVQNCPPHQAIAILGEVLLAMACPWEVQHDVLEHLKHVRYRSREGGAVLARCILSASMPVVGRLQALHLLVSRRQVGVRFLRQLVQLDAAHPVVRAMAIRLLVPLVKVEPDVNLVRELRPLLTTRAAPSPVRQEAAHALGILVQGQGQGQEGTLRDEVRHALLSALSHPSIDTLHIAGIIRALGTLGEASVVPVLRAMFEPELSEYVRERWGSHAPRLAEVPVQEWPDLPLPRETRAALLTALTEGEADGEQPGSFSELVEQAVLRIRLAAADALAHIGSHSNDQATRQQVRMALFEALQTTPHPHELRELLTDLARVSETGGVDELQYLLSHPATNITLRWLAVEQLGTIPDALPVLIEALEHRPLDPLTRGTMALALGTHGAPQAVPLLCRLAARRENDPHVRTQAVIALHHFAGLDGFGGSEAPAIAETLLAIVADTTAPLPLRSTAARTLPLPLHSETRRWLREVLRQEHQPPDLIVGVLHSLGQDRDLEALTLMVRYAHSEYPTVALAALEALAEVGDESVAPLLIHLAQDTNLTQGVRLHAVVTLLRLGGAEYLPLLRQFLESEVLPLQLQALNCLLSLWPEEAQPMRLVANATAPLALRLRALEEVTCGWGEGTEPQTREGEEVYEEERSLSALLIDGSQPPRLRAALASICGQAGSTEAVRALAQSARDHTTLPYVRRLCVRALETHARRASAQSEGEGFSVALYTLGELSNRLASDDVCREWAMQALLSAMKMREE